MWNYNGISCLSTEDYSEGFEEGSPVEGFCMVSEMYARTYVRTCLALPISILLQALLHKWLDTFDTIAITEDFLAAMGQRWPKATQENVTPADEAAAPAGAADRTILSPTDMAAPKVEVEATAEVEVEATAEVEAKAEVEEVAAQAAVDALAQAATDSTATEEKETDSHATEEQRD